MAGLMQCIDGVYVADSAVIVGDVTIGPDSSIWPHTAIRGDVAPIRIGQRVNVQDAAVLHCDHNVPLDIADEVVIAHGAIVHCRRIGSRTLIGNRATVLDGCEIGCDCIIAAGAVVPPDTVVPDGSVVMGLPGKVVRELRDQERAYIRRVVDGYVELARQHVAGSFTPWPSTRSATH
jgi:carbonic anhydrase/acetyltransferase-like protein (isoleucine patch superfamily)